MNVLLYRHGATAGNELRRYIGKTDESLSPAGIRQAKAAGSDPDQPLVYVTPLLRTRQTAAILFPNARQVVSAGLQEMDFGLFEGRSAAEMEADNAYRNWVDGGCLAPCPNGESREAFSARVREAFKNIILSHIALYDFPAIFVVHGGTIMAVLEAYARPAMSFYEGHAENGKGFLCRLSLPGKDGLPFQLTDIKKTDTFCAPPNTPGNFFESSVDKREIS